MIFKDHFSRSAASYARYRPRYPRALFDFVSGLCAQHRTAWDCATGNGQAAVELARYFEHVVATDASADQIAHATPHAGVTYRVATAEESGLADASVDLVTVAQALHWFDLDRFYSEVRRVTVPGGAVIAWSYGDPILDDPVLDGILRRFNHGTVGAYWPAERHAIGEGYRQLPFPFTAVPTPPLMLEQVWTLPELVGYLRTWSAVTAYRAAHGMDPVAELEVELGRRWDLERAARLVRWPLVILAGRVV